MLTNLKNIISSLSQKRLSLLLLAVAIAIISLIVYRFANQNNLLKNHFTSEIKNNSDYLSIKNKTNTVNYTGIGIAIFLLILIVFLSNREATKERKITGELRIQKEHLKVILNSISEGLITTDKYGKIIFMNHSAERLTQWNNEEAIGQPLEKIYQVVNEETGTTFENIVHRILEQKKSIELENNTILYTKHANSLIISNSGSPLMDKKKNISGTVLVFNDITKKKEIETKLKESESFSRGVIDALSSHIAVIDTEGNIVRVNRAWKRFAEMNGLGDKSLLGEGANYFTVCQLGIIEADATSKKALAGIQRVINNELSEFYLEYPCSSPSEEKWFYMRVTRFDNEEDMIIIEHHDITERKIAEIKKHKAIELYTIIAQGTSDTIWDWDIVSNQIKYNYGITQMFGFDIEEVVNISAWWEQHIHPDDLEKVKGTIREAFTKKIQNLKLPYRFRCSDGNYKFIIDRAFIIFDESGKPVRMIGAMQDITYQKEEEVRISKEIIHAQEEERQHIGSELHDNVNQILASTQMTLDMAKMKLTDPEKAKNYIDKTRTHIDQAIAEIRKLSHELAPHIFEDHSFRQVIENLLVNINIHNQFEIQLHLDEMTDVKISNDIQKNLYRILQEQLKNIIKYAMATKIEVAVHILNNTIQLRIHDNGKGFNTHAGKADGIGLRNIKRRAELFNGKCNIHSAVGKGCEIMVHIPLETAGSLTHTINAN